jgi:tRNA/rRNA methyltransferase
MPTLLRSAGQGEIALVFGPEPSGLTTAEIALCHYLLHIPTNPEYGSLNLAQATAICLYECHVQRLPPIAVSDIADHAAQARMFEHLEEGLRSIHYLYGEKADSLMAGIRHLLGRAMPTETELRMLHGLARQLRWIADQANSPKAD